MHVLVHETLKRPLAVVRLSLEVSRPKPFRSIQQVRTRAVTRELLSAHPSGAVYDS